MGYALFDIEVTQPLPDLPLGPADSGAAITLRRKGVPIAFWMQERTGSGVVKAGEVAERAAAEAASRILREALLEELRGGRAKNAVPSLTIAICTRNRPEGIQRLLASLSRLTVPPDACADQSPMEILVVDNAPSDDRTRDLVSECPEVSVRPEPQPGLNFARNRALREARGELLAFLDDDVVVDRGWLEGLCDAWNTNRDAAAFTGQVLPMEHLQVKAAASRLPGIARPSSRPRSTDGASSRKARVLAAHSPRVRAKFRPGCGSRYRIETSGHSETGSGVRWIPDKRVVDDEDLHGDGIQQHQDSQSAKANASGLDGSSCKWRSCQRNADTLHGRPSAPSSSASRRIRGRCGSGPFRDLTRLHDAASGSLLHPKAIGTPLRRRVMASSACRPGPAAGRNGCVTSISKSAYQ